MLLIFGTIGITLASVFYAIVLLGCRNPLKPRWTNEFLTGNIYVPAIIALYAAGGGCIVQWSLTITSQPPSYMELILAIGSIGLGLFVLKMLHIKKRLAAYASTVEAGKIIQSPVWTTHQPERSPAKESPVRPTSGNKAA